MEKYPWSVSVKVVNDEVLVDRIIPFDDDFPKGTWVLDSCIWATENQVSYVAQKRIKTGLNRREKNVIFQSGSFDKMYSIRGFIDLMTTPQ
jgi:hypothetical protein